jgi:predicted RNA-binding Zn ribbon-like protein
MPNTTKTVMDLKRIGGHPVLDFVNTVNHWTHNAPQCDYLGDYAGLLRLSRDVGVLDAREARVLGRVSAAQPAVAERQYRDALNLRHALHEVMQASVAGRAANPREVRIFGEWYRRAARARGVRVDHDGKLHVDWTFVDDDLPLELPLLKLAWFAVEFMLSVEPGRLKECPTDVGCGWMFHDSSKNRSRRWCDMGDCGNVAKARRHYARVRKTRATSR